mmetsp:Transcript_29610/g.89644  ORF Transcript_29610/g.89644 Transcript_29610/m.89644 type:complete len:466 (-) Transcript_29610:194-1591(-)
MSAIPALAWCKSLGFLCADSRAVVGVRVASRRCNFAARQLCADPEVRYRLEADAWHWKDILPCFCVKGNCLGVTGDLFVVADSGPLNSFAVELWGLKARSPVKTLNGHTNSVGAMDRVASAPNLLATGSRDCTVRIWDLNADTSMVLRGHKHWIHGVRFSPLGDKVVSGSEDKTARVWAVGTGALISTLACHTEFVFTVDFWQDTRVLTGGQDGQVVLWEETGEEVRKIPGRLLATLWDTLIAVTKDKTVMVYSAEALGGGEQAGPVAIMELVGYSDSAAFRPDGKQLAIAGWCDGKVFVHVWDILGGSRLFRLAVGSHRSTFELIYASTTGELLVLIGDEGCVQLWGDASAPGAVAAAGDANAPGAAALGAVCSSDGPLKARGQELRLRKTLRPRLEKSAWGVPQVQPWVKHVWFCLGLDFVVGTIGNRTYFWGESVFPAPSAPEIGALEAVRGLTSRRQRGRR